MIELPLTRNVAPDDGTVVICATQRLARNLRIGHDRAQAAQGLARWRPLATTTLLQWLDGVVEEAILVGVVPAADAPALPLSAAQDTLLWERVIEADGDGAVESMFFDREGLAAAAAEANGLIEGWGVRVTGEFGEETRRFLRWRAEYRRRCAANGWLEPVRVLVWQIGLIEAGCGRLPPRIVFAGFDRYMPQERRLIAALAARGVELAELETGLEAEAAATLVALPDRDAECRAAVAWAAAQRAGDPARRIGIVVPELSALRARLAALLDEALHPQALAAVNAEMPRDYNFSLGLPLASRPVVATALRLLRLACTRRVEQAEVSELLLGAYWSLDESEADARALLDAEMRETLGPVFSWERLLRFVRRHGQAQAPRLLAHLEALRAAVPGGRQPPAQWLPVVRGLLAAAGWPGERALTSHEYQARRAFDEALAALAEFDGILGRVTLADAVGRLARACRDRVFQPETEGEPHIQIMGPLEAAGASFDALWAMNMNDDVWPAAASANPLLPAEAQRRAGTPGASAEIEARFAAAIHARLLKSALEVVFSWAQGEGDRVRRISPLVAGLPAALVPAAAATAAFVALPGLAEAQCGALPLAALADHRAPPVGEGERVSGGTALLQAQAICPAWAFYRYRLGARALGEPVEGMDAMARGSLVHAMLEAFWTGRGSADLAAMSSAERDAAVAAAIDAALAAFDAQRDEPLPPRVRALERERLTALAASWLEIEAGRPVPFRVVACEETHRLDIEGLAIRLTVDRIDELDDGRRIILDYKTGRAPDWKTWGAMRIAEPQLPAYAAWLGGETGGERGVDSGINGGVEGVAFAVVRAGEAGFVGLAATDGLLPEVPSLDDRKVRRYFAEAGFVNWQSLLAHWHAAIGEVAAEVKAGVAAVVFENEAALDYCEVRPLLRLAERRAQAERDAERDAEAGND